MKEKKSFPNATYPLTPAALMHFEELQNTIGHQENPSHQKKKKVRFFNILQGRVCMESNRKWISFCRHMSSNEISFCALSRSVSTTFVAVPHRIKGTQQKRYKVSWDTSLFHNNSTSNKITLSISVSLGD